jgi:hypothetical protein
MQSHSGDILDGQRKSSFPFEKQNELWLEIKGSPGRTDAHGFLVASPSPSTKG